MRTIYTGFAILVISLCSLAQLGAQHVVFPLNLAPAQRRVVDMGTLTSLQGVIRAERLILNPHLQGEELVRIGDTILVEAFGELQVKASIDKMSRDVNGSLLLRAKVSSLEHAWLFVSTHEGLSLVQLELPERNRLMVSRYDPASESYLWVELDKGMMDALEGADAILPPAKPERDTDGQEAAPEKGHEGNGIPKDSGPLQESGGSKAQTTITVLVAYTPAAAAWSAANETSIHNTIALALGKGQLALDNSNTELTIQLVHAALVDYVEVNSSDDLYNLTDHNDGYMDTVHALRDYYCADLVVLLAQVNFAGGVGWLLNSLSGSPTHGFSLTRVQQASWTYTVIHEIGHNMGCHHHKQQITQPGPGLWSYSAGWRWTGTNNGKYCSVMTYESGASFPDGINHTRVAHFSNPAISYQGGSTGHATDGDNARTLRQIKDVIAGYRTNCTQTDPCNQVIAINGCGSSHTKTYTGGGSGVWFTSTANPCTYASPGIEQIYSFVAPVTGTYSLQVTAASGYVDYLWRQGSCSSAGWTCIEDILLPGQYGNLSWTAGTTYYILLDDENSTPGTHTFYLNCPSPPNPVSVTASATPSSVCSGQGVQLQSTASGGNSTGYAFAWASSPAGFSSTQQNPLVFPAVNTTYTVTLSDGSTSAAASTYVTVHALPNVSWSNSLSQQCISATAYSLSGGSPVGGSYSGPGVSGAHFNASAAGLGTHVLTYTYTDGNACTRSATNSISVNNLPAVSWGNILADQCITSTVYALSGGSPVGGSYSGPGVSGTHFNASAAGLGAHILTYTYTDGNGCPGSATNTITVHGLPLADAGSNQIIPNGSTASLHGSAMGGASPYSYLWSPAYLLSTSNTINNPVTINLSQTETFTLVVTDNNQCQSQPSQVIIEIGQYSQSLQGKVRYANALSEPISGIQVTLSQYGIPVDTCITDPSGEFLFTNASGPYTLSAETSMPWPYGAANASDALNVMKHFVKTDTLTGVHLLAADVNASQSVNSTDALQIAQRFVGTISGFAAGVWVFMDHDIYMSPHATITQDIECLVFGDVNASYVHNVKSIPDITLKLDGAIPCDYMDETRIPIRVTRHTRMAALSLVLIYPEKLLELLDVKFSVETGICVHKAGEGTLKLAWYSMEEVDWDVGDTLLWLHLRIKDPRYSNAHISPWSIGWESEASSFNGDKLKPLEMSIPQLTLCSQKAVLGQNRPNPHGGVTEIPIFLPEEGHVLLQVTNSLGQVVTTLVDKALPTGPHQIAFACRDCPSGIYHYTLIYQSDNKSNRITKRMIIHH